jgi:immune inhibitor A
VDNDPAQVHCTEIGNRSAVSQFTDALGWYPGIEVIGGVPYFRDWDASVVIPSTGNQPYSTRIVDEAGNPRLDLYGATIAGHVMGSGNPGDDGVQLGVTFTLVRAGAGNQYATVHVTTATP